MAHERAVLAGGCFWGMQDLIRKHPGVLSTRVGYTGGDVPNATIRNHGTHAEAIEILFDPEDLVSPDSRVLLPDPRPDHAEPAGQRPRAVVPLGDLLRRRGAKARSPRTPSPTWTPRACGRARWSPRWSPWARSGRPSRSTRITCSASRTATPAISCVRTGCCRSAKGSERSSASIFRPSRSVKHERPSGGFISRSVVAKVRRRESSFPSCSTGRYQAATPG